MPVDEFSLDADSLQHLEQVKKGKPRRFVLLCKGQKILSLILFKKGSISKYKKQAKEQGTGQLYFGVADGKGVSLTFQLAASDGFTDEPTSNPKLKEFINVATGGSYKPEYLLVAETPLVLDEEDPLVRRFLSLQPRMQAAGEADEGAAKLFAALGRATGSALQEGESQIAEEKINEIERELARLGSVTPSTENGGTATAAPSNTPPSNLGDLLAKLNMLKPAVVTAATTFPDRKAELLGLVGAVQAAITGGDADAAKQGLLQLGELLRKLKETPVAPSQPVNAPPEQSSDPKSPSLVVLQQSRLVWEQTRKKIQAELEKLEKSIREGCDADEEVGADVVTFAPLQGILDRLDARLTTKLDDALNAADAPTRQACNRDAREIVREYLSFVETSPLLAVIDKDSGFTPVAVRDTAVKALQVLAGKL